VEKEVIISDKYSISYAYNLNVSTIVSFAVSAMTNHIKIIKLNHSKWLSIIPKPILNN